jgi:hypothetical protein
MRIEMILLIMMVSLIGPRTEAREWPAIERALARGTEWSLNVDGKAGPMTVVRPLGARAGGRERSVAVRWQKDGTGTLIIKDNEAQAVQSVQLKLAFRTGAGYECRGYISRQHTLFMGGTCSQGRSQSAWFAITGNEPRRAPRDGRDAQIDRRTMAGLRSKIEQLEAAKSQSESSERTLLNTVNRQASELIQCQTSLREASQGGGARRVASFQEIKDQIDPRFTVWRASGGAGAGKSDSSVKYKLPPNPTDNTERQEWLEALGDALYGFVDTLYTSSEMAAFDTFERQECPGEGTYCRITLRYLSIQYSLVEIAGGR